MRVLSSRRASTHFDAYAARIDGLRQRVRAQLPRVGELIGMQRQVVQEMAITELRQQKQRLVGYSNQARFAVAQIYDRAGTNKEPSNAPQP